jgi:hypothetical protein
MKRLAPEAGTLSLELVSDLPGLDLDDRHLAACQADSRVE